MTNEVISIIFLFFALWFTFVNIVRTRYKQTIPGFNILIMAAGWTGFIAFTWIL